MFLSEFQSIMLSNIYTYWNNQGEYDGHIYPTPPLGQDMTQGQFLSGV